MKKIIIVPLLLICFFAVGQVKDLPISFTKRGYVLGVDLDQKMIQIDFFSNDKNLGVEDVLRSQVFTLSNCEIINNKKKKITLNDLRSSDEIVVTGQWFQDQNEFNIQKIVVMPKQSTDDLEGKIDLINGDFAYIDGNRVKLAEGKKIKGDDKTGYKGQTYNSFSEIKPGVYAKVSGQYDDGGFFLAKTFTISPDVETSFDKLAATQDKEVYDKIYPLWIDPVKRKSLLGKDIEGLGKITNNELVQDYVNRVGQQLIPSYIKQKNKINFLFIVVDNPDLLAYTKANGLAVVYTGLLLNLESEAQLAVVLGHEITHAIYEHHAAGNSNADKAEKKKGLFNTGINIGTTLKNTFNETKQGIEEQKNGLAKNERQKEAAQEQKTKTEENQAEINGLITNTLSNVIDKNSINYSVDQENQSDRVGLSLATLAGYDPKEAPIVWKKLYGRYGKLSGANEAAVNKQLEAFKELQNKDKAYDAKGLTNQAIATVLTIKKVDYQTKDIRTHPEEMKRYKALNNLIALYWNDPKILEGARNNQDEYLKVINKLTERPLQKPTENLKEKPAEKPKPAAKPAPKKKGKS